jgi:D-glycero-alpha-D-manno-heptose-7-phosphate kinase
LIISKSPHRISFFGGGTDYPSYYLEHGGRVLGVTIDKFSYLNVRRLPPYFDHKHRVVYSKMENINLIEEINHPSVRETLRFMNIEYGVSIHHDGDIPAKSGMGSSSTFTVGLLNSLHALKGQVISKQSLMKMAIHIEQNLIKENVGSQDQAFASYGGLNVIDFLQNGEIIVNPIIMNPERLKKFQNSFVLIFTGLSRIASEIAGDQIKNTINNISKLNQMKSHVNDSLEILTNNNSNLDDFGDLLSQTWNLKRELSDKVSNSLIDLIYEKAIKSGAIGGKLLGAGGGGFNLFYVRPEKRNNVISALHEYLHVPFEFEFQGSNIVFYNPTHLE